jgi:tetratricopeptide (TPR) repeat protein
MPNQNQPAPAPGHLLIHSAREAADQGQWDRALMNFNQAIAANSAWNLDPDFKHDRAIALFHTGNQEGALIELNEAVTLQPDYGYRYAARAWMKQALKDIQGAMADYETAIALDPDDAISLNNLGLLEEQQGYRQEAKERFAAADELAQQNESPVPEAPSTKETQGPNLLSEIKRALQQPDGRKEFIAFIRNGFKL